MNNSFTTKESMMEGCIMALLFLVVLAPINSHAQRTKKVTTTNAISTTTNSTVAVVSKK